MQTKFSHSKTSYDSSLTHPRDSPSSVNPEQELFLNYEPNSKLSYKDKSALYCSLVALVKEEYPFTDSLQDRAAQLLKSLEPNGEVRFANQLVSEIVASSVKPPSSLFASILTLMSSSYSTIVAAVISFLSKTIGVSLPTIRCRLIKSDLITTVLMTIRPHTLPISQNETSLYNLIRIIDDCISLATPYFVRELGITTAIEKYTHREMIFQKVVVPSSQFVTFLISNRPVLSGDLFKSFIWLLTTFIRIGPHHHPSLEFVLASPIAMAFSSCLSLVERNDGDLWYVLININQSLSFWTRGSAEVAQSGIRMMQALFSEGFEDRLEQKMMHDKGGHGFSVVSYCHSMSRLLGVNVKT